MDFFKDKKLFETINSYTINDYDKILLKLTREITCSGTHKQMYNHWIKKLLPNKIKSLSFTSDDNNNYEIRFHSYTLPETLPWECRLAKMPYKAKITILINDNEIDLGYIPVMTGSCLCLLVENNNPGDVIFFDKVKDLSTKLIPDNELIAKKECISDPYGYYIISSERSLITQEKERTDIPLIIKEGTQNEIEFRYTYGYKNTRQIFKMRVGEFNSIKINFVNRQEDYVNIFMVLYILLYDEFHTWKWFSNNIINMILRFATREQNYKIMILLNLTMYAFKKEYINFSNSDRDIQSSILTSNVKLIGNMNFSDFQEYYTTEFFKNIDEPTLKIDQFCYFIYKYSLVLTNQDTIDLRDDWGNKIYDSGVKEIEILFDLMLNDILINSNREYNKRIQANIKDKKKFVRPELYIESFKRKAKDFKMFYRFTESFNGQWGLNKKRDEISENSKRDTPLALWSQAAKSDVQISKHSKIMTPREVHPTQRCRHCVSETPEGEKIGLIKNLSITSCFSLQRDENVILALLFKYNVLRNIDNNISELILKEKKSIKESEQEDRILENTIGLKEISERDFEKSKNVFSPKLISDLNFSPYTSLTPDIKNKIAESINYLDDDSLTDINIRRYVEDSLNLEEDSLINIRQEILEYAEDIIRGEDEKLNQLEDEELSDSDSDSDLNPNDNIIADDIILRERDANLYVLIINGVMKNAKDETLYIDINEFNSQNIKSIIKKIYIDIEVFIHESSKTLFIYTNSSRLICPFFVVKNKKLVVDTLIDKGINLTLDNLIKSDAIEFLSVKEETNESIIICNSVEKFKKLKSNEIIYTHCNINPIQIFSLSASVAPFANRQPGPRTSYQSSMIKQALGEYHTNYHIKMDTGFKRLLRASRAFTETIMYYLPKLDIMPSGQTLNVAFYPDPDNQEDATVLSNDCIESGMLNYYKYVTVTFEDVDKVNELCNLDNINKKQYFFRNIIDKGPMMGLPRINSFLKVKDCVICKKNKNTNKNTSIFAGIGEEGYVDKIYIKDNIIRIKLRKKRKYIGGDKMAIRYSQKGTVGRIDEDMIKISSGYDSGIKPDVYFNPHGFPSRQTMGLLLEGLLTKLSLYKGVRYNVSSFNDHDFEKIKDELISLGVNIEEEVVDKNGEKIDKKIYVVPLYEQALKHHVLDKFQVRSNIGIKDAFYHQPVGGRKRGGGLRVGEMEKDALVGHGVTEVIRDRLLYSSDVFKLIVCRTCGRMLKDSGSENGCYSKNFTVDDMKTNIRCNICKSDNLGYIKIPYPFKQLIHFLIYKGIDIKFKTKEIFWENDIVEKEDKLNDFSVKLNATNKQLNTRKIIKASNSNCTIGLSWIGNSCYMDSTLQSLFGSGSNFFIIKLLYDKITEDDTKCSLESRVNIQKELINISNTINGTAYENDKVENVTKLRELLRSCPYKAAGDNEQFYTNSARDSGEFLTYILNMFSISNTANKKIISFATSVDNDVNEIIDINNYQIKPGFENDVILTNINNDRKASVIIDVDPYYLNNVDDNIDINRFLVKTQDNYLSDGYIHDNKKYERLITVYETLDSPIIIFSIIRNMLGIFEYKLVNPVEEITLNDNIYKLTAITISENKESHYTCYYKCNNEWYFYDDMYDDKFKLIGSYDNLIRDDNYAVKRKGVQYYYTL